jgi:hypothetical protein
MPVSRPWKGWGSALFLELGRLSPSRNELDKPSEGEACVTIFWDWRVEAGTRVLGGSSNTGPRIARGIQSLCGSKLEKLVVTGQVPELVLDFTNGQCLRSMVMKGGDPEWRIRLPDSNYVYCKAGVLLTGNGEESALTKEEAAAFAHADATSSRWGRPVSEPTLGPCANCRSYVHLDGESHLTDYGVCTESRSPFDGRAVKDNSGCPAFSSNTVPPV